MAVIAETILSHEFECMRIVCHARHRMMKALELKRRLRNSRNSHPILAQRVAAEMKRLSEFANGLEAVLSEPQETSNAN